MAYEILQKSINDDIDAQKNDQSKTMNLWKMNREALGDDRAATLATQSQLLSVAKVKAMQAQALLKALWLKLELLHLIGQLDSQIQQNHGFQTMLGMS